jgi:hypothetical protein
MPRGRRALPAAERGEVVLKREGEDADTPDLVIQDCLRGKLPEFSTNSETRSARREKDAAMTRSDRAVAGDRIRHEPALLLGAEDADGESREAAAERGEVVLKREGEDATLAVAVAEDAARPTSASDRRKRNRRRAQVGALASVSSSVTSGITRVHCRAAAMAATSGRAVGANLS